MYKTSPWSLGDLINDGIAEYAETKDDEADLMEMVADQLDVSTKTLANYGRVAKAFSPDQRWESLEFSHHETVLKLGPDDREEWLARAAEGRWSVNRLRAELADSQGEEVGINPKQVESWSTGATDIRIYRRGVVIRGPGFKFVGRSKEPIIWKGKER